MQGGDSEITEGLASISLSFLPHNSHFLVTFQLGTQGDSEKHLVLSGISLYGGLELYPVMPGHDCDMQHAAQALLSVQHRDMKEYVKTFLSTC